MSNQKKNATQAREGWPGKPLRKNVARVPGRVPLKLSRQTRIKTGPSDPPIHLIKGNHLIGWLGERESSRAPHKPCRKLQVKMTPGA